MVNGIEHVAVVSKDTAALKDWYMEMYGAERAEKTDRPSMRAAG